MNDETQAASCGSAPSARGWGLVVKARGARLEARSYFSFSSRLRISATVLESLESVASSRYLE